MKCIPIRFTYTSSLAFFRKVLLQSTLSKKQTKGKFLQGTFISLKAIFLKLTFVHDLTTLNLFSKPKSIQIFTIFLGTFKTSFFIVGPNVSYGFKLIGPTI